MSAAEKAVAREAMVLWDDLIAPNIVEKDGLGADIVFANTTTGPAQAWAYYPGNGPKYQSDVWTADPSENWTNEWLQYDGYGRTTLIHESGIRSVSATPVTTTSATTMMGTASGPDHLCRRRFLCAGHRAYLDHVVLFGAKFTAAKPVNGPCCLLSNPQTPLLHDILTIQAKYGADPTTRAGTPTTSRIQMPATRCLRPQQ